MSTGVVSEAGRFKKNVLIRNIIKYKWIYVMLIPPVAYFIVFKYMPLYGVQLAFKDHKLGAMSNSIWNDYAHFKFMLSEPGFIPAFRNTIIISFMRILVGFPFPIILALLINEVRMIRFKRVLQTVYTFPHFLSWVLLSGIMLNLLGTNGMVRKIVGTFSQPAFDGWNLLYDGFAFRWLLIFTDIWKSAGWGTIIYLAAIAGVDQALYESADIDGANRFHKIYYITMPGIVSMITIQLILRVGAMMEGGFDQIFTLYSAPVFPQGDIIDTYIYRISFVRASGVDFGFPTAVGLFKNIINFILLLSANALTRALGQRSVL